AFQGLPGPSRAFQGLPGPCGPSRVQPIPGRLVLSPVMFLVIPDHQRGAWLAYLLWFALSLSDGIDGWVARRHGTTSTGAFLDPLADKVLVLGAMFTLVSRDMFPLLPVLLIAGRELVISVYRVLVGSKGVSVPASKIAKYKTVVQQLAVGFALWPWFAADYRWLWMGLLWLAVALALVSGAQYLLASRAARK
ncbi:MAG: CDP-alcohol phosphatidyltransferase family protein, partial [Ilumatobacteraceae bacterium]